MRAAVQQRHLVPCRTRVPARIQFKRLSSRGSEGQLGVCEGRPGSIRCARHADLRMGQAASPPSRRWRGSLCGHPQGLGAHLDGHQAALQPCQVADSVGASTQLHQLSLLVSQELRGMACAWRVVVMVVVGLDSTVGVGGGWGARGLAGGQLRMCGWPSLYDASEGLVIGPRRWCTPRFDPPQK